MTMVEQLQVEERRCTEILSRFQGRKETLTQEVDRIGTSIQQSELQQKRLTEALSLLRQVSELSRKNIKEKIELLVSFALQKITGSEDYLFQISFEKRRGQIECDFNLETSRSMGDPTGSNGGGVWDIISLTLRLALKSMAQVGGPLILDEPGKWLHEERRPDFMQLLKEASEEANTQVLMSTHIDEFQEGTDQLIGVKLEGDHSVVDYL